MIENSQLSFSAAGPRIRRAGTSSGFSLTRLCDCMPTRAITRAAALLRVVSSICPLQGGCRAFQGGRSRCGPRAWLRVSGLRRPWGLDRRDLAESGSTVDKLTDFRAQALAQLAAQHDGIARLRRRGETSSNVRKLQARTASRGHAVDCCGSPPWLAEHCRQGQTGQWGGRCSFGWCSLR